MKKYKLSKWTIFMFILFDLSIVYGCYEILYFCLEKPSIGYLLLLSFGFICFIIYLIFLGKTYVVIRSDSIKYVSGINQYTEIIDYKDVGSLHYNVLLRSLLIKNKNGKICFLSLGFSNTRKMIKDILLYVTLYKDGVDIDKKLIKRFMKKK